MEVVPVAVDHPELVTPLDDAALAAEAKQGGRISSADGQGDLFG